MTQVLTFGPDDYPLQHSPGWVGPNNCYIHGYEPCPDRPYRVCFECGHVYATAEDLRSAYRHEIQEMAPELSMIGLELDPLIVPPADEISFCQECVHDF